MKKILYILSLCFLFICCEKDPCDKRDKFVGTYSEFVGQWKLTKFEESVFDNGSGQTNDYSYYPSENYRFIINSNGTIVFIKNSEILDIECINIIDDFPSNPTIISLKSVSNNNSMILDMEGSILLKISFSDFEYFPSQHEHEESVQEVRRIHYFERL